jgi:CheY-like chemotaxis protein
MVGEPGNKKSDSQATTSGDIFEISNKKIETYSIIAFFCLVAAILLIIFGQKYIAAALVAASIAAGIIIYRRVSEVSREKSAILNELNQMTGRQDELITNFSHHIREPLNNIVIITDMLQESGLQKKQMELLETFIASTNNMVTIVNELSMHTTGIPHERKAIRFNIISTIENTFDLYRLKDQVNLDFIFNKKEVTGTEFMGDPILLKQIFLDLFNIIENHASEKAITVTINLRKTRETSTESTIGFRIQVDKHIALIDDSRPETSIAAKLITAGKGVFDQESGPNHTILNFYLPFTNTIAEIKQRSVSTRMDELAQKEKAHKNLKDIKVLLVEDNLINQKITILTLSPLVGSIDTASNGKEALDKFGTSNYDIILMDVQMPVMSGLTAAEKIRQLESTTNSHVPIIAITANAMIGDKEKCIAVGMDDYISKPFQPAALLEKIKKII